jgi:two-component system sensor histidine kinase HydH
MDVKAARSLSAEGAARTTGRPRESRRAAVVSAADLFEALLADTENGVLLLDPDRHVARVNAAAASMLGTTVSGARGAAAAALLATVVPGDDPVAEGYRRRTSEYESMLVTQRGGELPVSIRTFRLGSPPWLLVTLRDLTGVRRMHEELRRKERLALLGQLATGVAHEIRNPLAGIGTSAQVLLRRFEPRDERARFVQVILDEVARLDRIVTSLLQYSRPRSPVLQRTELPPLVAKVIELLADNLAASGVRVETEIAVRSSAVYLDPDLVMQVLLNVSLNAVQAMPTGGRLRFEVRRVRRRQAPRGPGRRATDRDTRGERGASSWVEYAQVRVIDTGTGIPRGVLRKLFHPFFTTKPEGTGLGLAISQTIMHEHQGNIEVASREGRGTTVMLNFPREKRHGQRREPHPHPDAAHPARR